MHFAHVIQSRIGRAWAVLIVLAIMLFWPAGKHRFGWFLEPAYDYSFAGGHQQSIGMSVGVLIGIR